MSDHLILFDGTSLQPIRRILLTLPGSIPHNTPLKILRKTSCYDIWEGHTTFYLLILSQFSDCFSIDHKIPLDIIKYIIILVLQKQQEEISNLLEAWIECNQKTCIIKFWRNVFPFNGSFAQHMHCYTDGCHTISNWKESNKCEICLKVVCHTCMTKNVWTPTGLGDFVCNNCMLIKIVNNIKNKSMVEYYNIDNF